MDRELPLGIAVLISETLLGLECIFLGRFGKFTLGFEIEFAFLEIHVLPKIEVVAEFLLILIEPAKILKHPGLKPKPLGIILLLLGFQGSFWLLWRLRGHVRFAQPKGLIVLIALVALHKYFVLLRLFLLFIAVLRTLCHPFCHLLLLYLPVGRERLVSYVHHRYSFMRLARGKVFCLGHFLDWGLSLELGQWGHWARRQRRWYW